MAKPLRSIVKKPSWARSKSADEFVDKHPQKIKNDAGSEHEKNFTADYVPVYQRGPDHMGVDSVSEGRNYLSDEELQKRDLAKRTRARERQEARWKARDAKSPSAEREYRAKLNRKGGPVKEEQNSPLAESGFFKKPKQKKEPAATHKLQMRLNIRPSTQWPGGEDMTITDVDGKKHEVRRGIRGVHEGRLLGRGMSKAAREADVEQSDIEYIAQQQKKRKAKDKKSKKDLKEANSFQQAKVKFDWHRDKARSHEAWGDVTRKMKPPIPNAPGSKFTDLHKAKRHRQAMDAATRVMSKRFGLKEGEVVKVDFKKKKVTDRKTELPKPGTKENVLRFRKTLPENVQCYTPMKTKFGKPKGKVKKNGN